MPDVGTAVTVGLPVATKVLGAGASAKGASKAAGISGEAASQAIDYTQSANLQNRYDLTPYRNAGTTALGRLNSLVTAQPVSDSAFNSATQNYSQAPRYSGKQYVWVNKNTGEVTQNSPYVGMTPQDQAYWTQQVQTGGNDAVPWSAIDVTGRSLDDVKNQFSSQYGSQSDLGSLNKKFSFSDFQQDPGYQFRLDEGQKALDRSAAARGGMFSGAAYKAGERYAQDYASGEFGKASDRYVNNQNQTYNQLAGLASIGQNAANNTVNSNTNAANNVTNTMVGNANVQGANAVAQGNAIGTGLNSVGNMFANLGSGLNGDGNIGSQPYIYQGTKKENITWN